MKRTNPLVLLISSGGIGILIITLFLIFYFSKNPTPQTSQENNQQANPTPTTTSITYTTYNHPTYPISITYPDDFSPIDQADPYQIYLSPKGQFLQAFQLNTEKYPNTSLKSAYLTLSAVKNSSATKCVEFPNITQATSDAKTAKINDQEFTSISTVDGKGGALTSTIIYHTLLPNSTCLEATLNITQANLDNFDPSLKILPVNQDEIWNKLGSVLSTLKISTSPTPTR